MAHNVFILVLFLKSPFYYCDANPELFKMKTNLENSESFCSRTGRPDVAGFKNGSSERTCPLWGCLGHMPVSDVYELFQLGALTCDVAITS